MTKLFYVHGQHLESQLKLIRLKLTFLSAENTILQNLRF
jgi:hypothetical protein